MKTLYTVQTANSWEFLATTIDVQEFHSGSTFTCRYLHMADLQSMAQRYYCNGRPCTRTEYILVRDLASGGAL